MQWGCSLLSDYFDNLSKVTTILAKQLNVKHNQGKLHCAVGGMAIFVMLIQLMQCLRYIHIFRKLCHWFGFLLFVPRCHRYSVALWNVCVGFEGDKAAVLFCCSAARRQCECSKAVWHWQGCGSCFITCLQLVFASWSSECRYCCSISAKVIYFHNLIETVSQLLTKRVLLKQFTS